LLICAQRAKAIEAFTGFPDHQFKEGSKVKDWYFVAGADECASLCESMLHCPSFVFKTKEKTVCFLDNESKDRFGVQDAHACTQKCASTQGCVSSHVKTVNSSHCLFDNITLGPDWDAELANNVTVAREGAGTLYNRSIDCTTPFKCGDVANYRFGFTAYPGVKYRGNIGSGLFSGTIEECAKACAADAACTSFQYKHNKGKCQLEPLDGQEARSMVGTLAETIDAKFLQDRTRIITFWHKDVACTGEANGDRTASVPIGAIAGVGVVMVLVLVFVLIVRCCPQRFQKDTDPPGAVEEIQGEEINFYEN
jgi:hypothetical protein